MEVGCLLDVEVLYEFQRKTEKAQSVKESMITWLANIQRERERKERKSYVFFFFLVRTQKGGQN